MKPRFGMDLDCVSGSNDDGVRNIEVYRSCRDQQVRWALSKGLHLIGSKGDRGEPAYTTTRDANLFEPLSADAEREIEQGDGEELVERGGPCKMQAVHSSSALTVNVFHYWRHQPSLEPMLAALGLPAAHGVSLEFEAKRPVMENPDRNVFKVDPNLDVVIRCDAESCFREIAVECKFTEPYRPCKPEDKGLKWPYLRQRCLWEDIPACHSLARRIGPRDEHFQHLHAAQLVKHILGLKQRSGKTNFGLVYLWYDVPFPEGDQHRSEVEEFAGIVADDGISFRGMTFQDLIKWLAHDRLDREAYVEYLEDRYLVQ